MEQANTNNGSAGTEGFSAGVENEGKKQPRLKKLKSFKKPPIILAVVAIVGMIAMAATVFAIKYINAPVHIGKKETIMALSSRSQDAPVKSEFRVGDPVMLRFEFSDAPVGKAVQFEVRNSKGEAVRNGSTTVLRASDQDKADGQRYVSIVNAAPTILEADDYKIVLSIDGQEVSSVGFKVIGE